VSLSAAKLALAVKRSRTQGGAPEILHSEPIAVIGIGCRFPGGADTPDLLWELLRQERSAIVPTPEGRWPRLPELEGCECGFVREVDRFDAAYFGIPAREAERMDPQHRLLLEVIWEALWDARLAPESTAGERNALFAAIYSADYFRLQFRDPKQINAYSSSGTSHSTAVGRASFLLDWKGPSVAVDTACSSSLVAVHLACQSLRAGECRMALAGGVNLMLEPEEMLSLTRMGMLSPDWRCKTFDAGADGFVPGEGCGVVVLKRLADALADRDPIRAVIRGTATNQDGRTSVLTAPNGLAQREVICDALANAQISGSEVGYVEAHGTGTALGDPIELEALAEVLGRGPQPCYVGSVKTNIGHLEAGAGVAGVIKAVLTLEHETIPRSLFFERLNPHVSIDGTRLAVAGATVAWPRGPVPRFAGVSSFGFGGTNAHVILEEAPAAAQPGREPTPRRAWNRTRLWFAPAWPATERPLDHPLAGRRFDSPAFAGVVFENALSALSPAYLGDHRPGGQTLFPLAATLEVLLAASGASSLDDVSIDKPLALSAGTERRVQAIAEAGRLRFFSHDAGGWTLHASAQAGAPAEPLQPVQPADLVPATSRRIAADDFYRDLDERNLHFGPAFRLIQDLWVSGDCAVARIAGASDRSGYRFHPPLLDACLQAAGALLPDRGAYLPVGIRRFTLLQDSPGPELWCRASARTGGESGLTFDVEVYSAEGAPVARVEAMTVRKAVETGGPQLAEIAWRLVEGPDAAATTAPPGRWLILADAGGAWRLLADRLQAGGASYAVAMRGEPYEHLLADPALSGVAHFWSLDAPDPAGLSAEALLAFEGANLESVLRVLQGLVASQGSPARLAVVTRGAQAAGAGPVGVGVLQAPVWGMLRSARREHSELTCLALDLDPRQAADDVAIEEILAARPAAEVAYRAGRRYLPSLAPAQGCSDSARLEIGEKGSLESLRWVDAASRKPGAGEVEIEIAATGLNFRDVLNALGEYPGEPGPLGSECAGRIVSVGAGVERFRPGDEVMAIARGTFATRVVTSAGLTQSKPRALSMEEAAVVPIAWVTTRYALRRVGKLRAGERVLIHAAAGGVGMAAVQEALRAGAEVFATAGSEEKRALLRSLGVHHVESSRTLDYSRVFREKSGGKGVDLVLNSLSGEHISESLKLLAPGGRFLELGKNGVWSNQQAAGLRPDVAYSVLDWSEEFERAPGLVDQLFEEIAQDLDRGAIQPSPCRVFGRSETVAAFRWMAQARHIGKIALRCDERQRAPRRDASYLVTGGLGKLGMEVAECLAAQGAGEVVLVSRGEPGAAARAAIERMRSAGARVTVRSADLASGEQVEQLLRDVAAGSLPLKGVIHAAGVLSDGVITELDRARVEQVLAPKAIGAWRLHERLAGADLDFFVLYSSLASAIGSPGQANYSAANAFLDALAHYRRSLGLPALSINWGPWGEAGMAAEASGWRRAFPTLTPLSSAKGLELWNKMLRYGSSAQLAAFELTKGSALRDLEAGVLKLAQQSDASSADLPTSGGRGRTLTGEHLVQFLREEVVKVMGIEGTCLEPDAPLFDAGLDSLMAVEFRNGLCTTFGRRLPSTLLFDYPTLKKLAEFLEAGDAPAPEDLETRLSRQIGRMTDDEAEILLKAELGNGA
jgi:acyl transferase domain-containing protein/acyl carrier protein